MSKHTSTPWYAGENSVPTELQKGSHTILIESDGYIIAYVSSWRNDPDTEKEAFANANLIAAAPDLLAALKFISKLHSHETPNIELAQNMYEAASMARSAIAKVLT